MALASVTLELNLKEVGGKKSQKMLLGKSVLGRGACYPDDPEIGVHLSSLRRSTARQDSTDL